MKPTEKISKRADSSPLKGMKGKRKFLSSSSSSSSSTFCSCTYSCSCSSSSSSYSSSDSDMKKKRYRRKRRRSSSSDSSSSSSSSSSDASLKKLKKKCKKKSILKKIKMKAQAKKEKICKKKKEKKGKHEEGNGCADVPLHLMDKSKSMAPMTKEQWEKQQNVVRRVFDESTGRHRLIKGDGEVIEEVVSRQRHQKINQQATKADGAYFQNKLSGTSY